MNKDFEMINVCPGCKSAKITTLRNPEKTHIFVTEGDELQVTTGLGCCENCGLTFLNPKMSMEKLFEYYSKQSRIPRTTIERNSPFDVQMDIQIDFIKKYIDIKPGMKILEIGCAEGFFLKKFKEKTNQDVELFGVELSKKYLEQAEINLKGSKIYDKPLEETDFGNLKFDVIVLRHVFEHLNDPADALKRMREILTDGGVLYIEVPDSENIVVQLSNFYHHEHLLYFTPEILSNYFSAFGFRTLNSRRFEDNPVGSGFEYPVIQGICTPGNFEKLKPMPGVAKAIYIENAKRIEQANKKLFKPVKEKLLQKLNQNKKIGLFGAGPHTMDILAKLEDTNIDWQLVFDNNQNKHGKKMRKIPIVKPTTESLKSVDCILVSSAAFEKEMVAQIKSLSPNTEIITIYNQF